MIRFKILICVSISLCVAVPMDAQVIPRQAQVTAAEYFVGNDPGVGKGTLDTIFANVVDTSLTANIMPLLKIASLYGWSVAVSDGYATVASQDSFLFRTSDNITAVHGPESLPKVFALYQNYPNPFNPTTTISYDIPERSRVTLVVYDILGRRIQTLVDGEKQAGHHEVIFDASRLPSGIYLYRLQAGNFSETRKLTLVK